MNTASSHSFLPPAETPNRNLADSIFSCIEVHRKSIAHTDRHGCYYVTNSVMNLFVEEEKWNPTQGEIIQKINFFLEGLDLSEIKKKNSLPPSVSEKVLEPESKTV